MKPNLDEENPVMELPKMGVIKSQNDTHKTLLDANNMTDVTLEVGFLVCRILTNGSKKS